MKRWIFIVTFLGLLAVPGTLFGFTLSVTPTHQTCPGNGSMTFNVGSTDPAGSITYLIYLLPNTTTPYATQNTTFLGGLSAGTYRVIATETVGTTATTQQLDVTINNNVVDLVFDVDILNQACSATSNIIVAVSAGTATTYEIISGPATFPPQTSNTFNNLVPGTYQIRVFDSCGNAKVQTFTVTINPAGLVISQPTFANTSPPSCTATVATNIITPAPGTVIGYPLSIQYTVNPPGGGIPIITNTSLPSGNATSQPISTTIPDYPSQTYTYNVSITDACGATYNQLFTINEDIAVLATHIPIGCNQYYMSLSATNFTPPFTLNFITFPAGFDPVAESGGTYPGPYNSIPVVFGSLTNPVPDGYYEFSITDACGRTNTGTHLIPNLPPQPFATGTNNGCLTNNGQIVVTIPDYDITSAIVTVAPASYPFPLPHDVTASVSNHVLLLNPVPLGTYNLVLADECGHNNLNVSIDVPVYTDQGLMSQQRPGCALNEGSIRIYSLNGKLTSITITSGPGIGAPVNGTNNIATGDGAFYMNGLVPGVYTFSATDECNFTNTLSVTVDGYVITNSSASLVANCGSFDIPLAFTSNGTHGQSFWLQKLIDPATDTWGHPAYPGIGTTYTNGTVPTTANSVPLTNNTTNLNYAYNGTFRVVRNFFSYHDGSDFNAGTVTSIDKACFEIVQVLPPFDELLEIVDINRMTCSTAGTLDVVVIANGSPPINYSLVEMNGNPYLFDNGTSNIFSNLAVGNYVVRIQDACGNVQSEPFDVSTLLSLVTIYQSDDIVQCKDFITNNEVFDLTVQNAVILGPQSPTDYTITYHTSLGQAQAGTGAISNVTAFNPTSNPQTIYARVVFNQLPQCYDTTDFQVIVGQNPIINLQPNYINCSASPVTLNAAGGIGHYPTTTYVWSDGTVGPVITVSQIGVTNLTVTATNSYGNLMQGCPKDYNITVTISEPPVIDHIETVDWTDTENSISIISDTPAAFDYSLDGTNFQDDNNFYNLIPGLYNVTIRDKAGCGIITKVVWLLHYPKFFTPNGDGINETWYIKNQQFEPDFMVEVYDRYGKLIKQFKSNTMGWDGTYNGAQNFSTDYWFVVHRQDGRVHKGHFTLKR